MAQGTGRHVPLVGLGVCALLTLTACAPREGYGLRNDGVPTPKGVPWRVAEATLFVAPDGPLQPEAQFAIPDLDAKRADIRIDTTLRKAMHVTLQCEGAARVHHKHAPAQKLPGATAVAVKLPPRGGGITTLEWRPASGTCQLRWGDGHQITLRPESTLAPHLSTMSRGVVTCEMARPQSLDALQRVFLDDGAMLQTCPVAPGDVRLLVDPLDALAARIEALTGTRVSHAALTAGNPDMPLDFSRAPKLDLIQLSYLHIRADYVGYLTARMLAFHAMRGTQVRILVTGLLMLEEDRIFYDQLAARYPNIQIQYYEWGSAGIAGPDDVINSWQRVQHTRSFLTLSRDPGRSRFIFGGRNQHDGFFFSEPFDLSDWPFLHTYDVTSFQDIGFYSVYEDVEVELRDDHAVRNVAAHQIALWNRDAETQQVGPKITGRSARTSGMRHYLSLPWADGRDQIRWFADAIDAAQRDVLIVTPYLNPPEQIQTALLRARQRGVRVRMVVRVNSTDPAGFIITALNRRYVARNAGHFEIEEYFPRPRMMHTKMMVIDQRLAVTTSTNLDHRAFWHDTENGLVFLDTPQVGALLNVVAGYQKTTRPLTPEEPQSLMGDFLYNWDWLRSVF